MTQTFSVEINHQGTTYTIEVPEDRKILEVANEYYEKDKNSDKKAEEKCPELPQSCLAGVCETCAVLLTEGTVRYGDDNDAMGLSPELREKGYALLCSAYPQSDIKLVTEKEDEVYDLQFVKQ
ncbi:MAG: 2Fe-2S iron-sulfur cluster binding domain-containing protein [Roseofilum sp. SBFL]|uniref:2Fe-2S iron-sulfur cluster-binding protein n=1 Tax=unclassified Roseofilum TaxID=2620099 RepID=UPI001B072016|nr:MULTISPECIES: 2Fe-2S iron-sulfur cluster-binding protein [unclassified Roseofilum]MBP0012741.1 2Fe-2S iron-sulfur cluster binding domain-containing protein [Roseofilum sp. SID3]MBP0026285.1 2Fe-2S iron-sulfur cluster binding domain-containing protein [Roseofilum sp. SID2]MBP0037103.1 2Fe-2S iron-sulfur cluster binding domain-containing protein [Roseofilum sp. SID1]MBP0043517.1 2Fe-2S iron-sulfur cluster binding domain-containing protein [Roseofilum sp. SBFL]